MIDISKDYGAVPLDPITYAGPDSSVQIQKAIDENPREWIFIPPGMFKCTQPLVIKTGVRLSGYEVAVTSYQPSRLVFIKCAGIRLLDDSYTGGAQGSIISDLVIRMLYRDPNDPPPDLDPTKFENDGIWSNAGLRVRQCAITGFTRYGICIRAATNEQPASRANRFKLDDIDIDDCWDGFYIEGYDANAGQINHCSAVACRGWGFVDNSALGNTYFSNHARTDIAGSYKLGRGASGVNASAGCGNYAEGDSPPSEFGDQVHWWGGTDAGGINGGQVVLPGNSHLRLQACGNAKTPPLTVMAGQDMQCPLVAFQDYYCNTGIAIGPNMVLGMGEWPGAAYPEAGNPSPPHLSIWSSQNRPLLGIGTVYPQGVQYAGPVGNAMVVCSGPNYGDAAFSISTMTSLSTYQETMRLGNGKAWVWDGQGWKQL